MSVLTVAQPTAERCSRLARFLDRLGMTVVLAKERISIYAASWLGMPVWGVAHKGLTLLTWLDPFQNDIMMPMAILLSALVFAGLTHAAERPTVVMIHGAGGGGWEYVVWKKRFTEAGYPVIAKDLKPANGGLAHTAFQDYVDQVQAWLPKNHGAVVLVGASMGGILALKVAETCHPQEVILVDSVPPLGVVEPSKGEAYPPVVRWANGPMKDTRDSMPDSNEAMIQYAFPRWRDESGAVMNQIRKGIASAKPKCPVLVIIGGSDGDVPPENSMALAKWAGGDIQRYAGMSHVGPLMSKRAAEVADAAILWLRARR